MRHYSDCNRPQYGEYKPEIRFIFEKTPKGRVGSINYNYNLPTPKDYTNAFIRIPKDPFELPEKVRLSFMDFRTMFMRTPTERIWNVIVKIPKELVLYKNGKELIAGIAVGGLFASSAYLERTDNTQAWMGSVCGESFGWIELSTGERWTNNKHAFRAPTAQEYIDYFVMQGL